MSYCFKLNQSNKFVYSNFDNQGNRFTICLDVDDMLIFDTYSLQIEKIKVFLALVFKMKDIGEVDVILGEYSNYEIR